MGSGTRQQAGGRSYRQGQALERYLERRALKEKLWLEKHTPAMRPTGARHRGLPLFVPIKKGFVDYTLILPGGGSVHFDAKTCGHQTRWPLPPSLRHTKPQGHQSKKLAALVSSGHRAGIYLRSLKGGRDYFIPWTAQGPPFEGASAAWEELERYRVDTEATLLSALTG